MFEREHTSQIAAFLRSFDGARLPTTVTLAIKRGGGRPTRPADMYTGPFRHTNAYLTGMCH